MYMNRPLPPVLRLLGVNDVKGHVHERSIVKVGLPDLDEEHLDLLAVPAEAPRQGPQGNGLQAVEQDGAPVEADGLEDLVLGPGADGDVEDALGDVCEAGAAHGVGELGVGDGVEVDAQGGEAVGYVLPEAGDGVVGGHLAVAACEGTSWRVMDLL